MRRPLRAALIAAVAAGTVALTPVAASAQEAPPATDEAPERPARCDEGHWPRTVHGQPRAFKAGGAGGYYLWHDERGWHLRTTTPRAAGTVFEGQIVSSDAIRLVHQFRDERADEVSVEGNTLRFRFVTGKGVDGVDFVVGCTESVSFSLHTGGQATPTRRIWVGKTGKARSNPLTVNRLA